MSNNLAINPSIEIEGVHFEIATEVNERSNWEHYRSCFYGPFIKCGYDTGGGFKPLIYFSKTAKCWKVAHMNRAGTEWRAYLAAFNFCHKLNVRLMERK